MGFYVQSLASPISLPGHVSFVLSALGTHTGMGHIPLEVMPYVRAGKDEEGKFEWCLILIMLQHAGIFVLLFKQVTVCSGFSSELLFSRVPCSLTQAFFFS